MCLMWGGTFFSPIKSGFMSGLSNASTSKLETFLVLHPLMSLRLKKMQTSARIISRTTAQRVSPESLFQDNPSLQRRRRRPPDVPGRSFIPALNNAPLKLFVASLEYSHKGI